MHVPLLSTGCFHTSNILKSCLSVLTFVIQQMGFFVNKCLHAFELELCYYPLNLFSLTSSSSSVVYDQHSSHLQSLEEQRDQMLREWTARVLWWHGVARQHKRRELLPAYFISAIIFSPDLYVLWQGARQACQAVFVVASNFAGNIKIQRKMGQWEIFLCTLALISTSVSQGSSTGGGHVRYLQNRFM